MKAIVALAVLLFPTAAWAQEGEEIFGARERAWLVMLSGDFRADGSILTGSDVDLESEFDFSPELFHDLSAWINLPLIVIDRINVGFWLGGFEESATIEETFTFGDSVFLVGTEAEAELDFGVFTFTIEKFLFDPGEEKLGVALGIQAGIKYFDIEASLRSETFGFSESEEAKGPLPMIGARLIAQVTGWFRFEAEVIGIGGAYADIRAAYVEGVLEAAFQPIDNVLVGLGYKLVLLRFEDESGDDFEVNLRLGGFFLMAGVKF